jgi:peroxiredoxin
LTEYRDRYQEIRDAGSSVVAVSVDAPKTSETLRRDLNMPFAILCDTQHRVVQEWDIYNAREKGGIAKPASFVIEPDRTVRYASVDSVAMRVPVSEILLVLQSLREERQVRRKTCVPRPTDWFRAIGNLLRR